MLLLSCYQWTTARLKKKIDDILVSLKTWTAPINVLDEEGKPMTVNLAACIGVEKAFDRLADT